MLSARFIAAVSCGDRMELHGAESAGAQRGFPTYLIVDTLLLRGICSSFSSVLSEAMVMAVVYGVDEG